MAEISFPYYGARVAWFCYHPAKHGPSYVDGQWERCSALFVQILNDFVAVAELYTDQQTLSEKVGGQAWKKDVLKLHSAVEKDGRDVYVLEALAEAIFDRDKKTEQRMLPYHDELKKRANDIRAEDLQLSMGLGQVDPSCLIKRGWGS